MRRRGRSDTLGKGAIYATDLNKNNDAGHSMTGYVRIPWVPVDMSHPHTAAALVKVCWALRGRR